MMKKAVWVIYLLMTACAVNQGPVAVEELDQSDLEVNLSDENSAALVTQPIQPESESSVLPIVNKLAIEADTNLSQGAYQQAINIAERGLRVDRKEPRFYLVLASAYYQLEDKEQSIDFAKQGLRYVSRQSAAFQQLEWFSRL